MKRSERSLAKAERRARMIERIAAERALEAKHRFTGRRLEADQAREIFRSIDPVYPQRTLQRAKTTPPRGAATYRGARRNDARSRGAGWSRNWRAAQVANYAIAKGARQKRAA